MKAWAVKHLLKVTQLIDVDNNDFFFLSSYYVAGTILSVVTRLMIFKSNYNFYGKHYCVTSILQAGKLRLTQSIICHAVTQR